MPATSPLRLVASTDDPDHDLRLARRAARGDEDAFSSLYHRHQPRVLRHCKRLLGSSEDAADATQQAFLSLHRVLAKGACPSENVPAYILQIARRACYEVHHRRTAQQRVRQLTEQLAADGGSVPDHASSVIAAHSVRAAAAALPGRHRAVLVMREVRDMSYEEIAGDLGITENAVAQLLHRARKRLAGELGPDWAPHRTVPLAA